MRSLAALVLLLVGAAFVPVATAGWWVRDTLVPGGAYVAAVTPLATDPAVVDAVEDRLTDQTMDTVAQASGGRLSAATRSRVEPVVRRAVARSVEDHGFVGAWRTSNKIAHDEVVAVLDGDSSAARVGPDRTVYVRLSTRGSGIRRELAADGVPFAQTLPGSDASLPLGHTDDLVKARLGYDLLRDHGGGLPVAAAVLLALGLLVARRRGPALGWTAFGVLGGLGLLAAGIAVARLYYLESLPSGLSRAAGTAVFDTVTAGLRQDIIVVAVVALVLLVLSAVLGRRSA